MKLFDRLSLVIGSNNIEKLENTKVLLVGLGGVGGSSFETLVRSAIGTIYVCDFDTFEESNLNRQVLSTYNVIGKFKTDIAEIRAKEINKDCNVIKINKKLNSDNLHELLPNKIDYIIDACDDVIVKIELIKFAMDNNIKIISSMGTGKKVKPELLEITNIWNTQYDPLAKKVRTLLKKEQITYKLPVVSSKEPPIKSSDNIVGSFAPVTNIAGILLASYVLNDIIK